MSLLHRRPKPLAPEERVFRDDRLIVVITEDTYAPEEYFKIVKARRVHVRVASAQGGNSSPRAVLASAHVIKADDDFKDFDEFWLLMDTDHWTRGNHRPVFMEVIQEARDSGFRVAISNPCFDLWLLLHHASLTQVQDLEGCDTVGTRFRELKGEFNKRSLKPAMYTLPLALEAINRAKTLTPDLQRFVPDNPGTQVWALVERALQDIVRKSGAS